MTFQRFRGWAGAVGGGRLRVKRSFGEARSFDGTPASDLVSGWLFDPLSAAASPADIMGADCISYFDAKTSALFQNSGGTGAVADGDPVGYLEDKVSGAYLQATSGWRPTYVANAGDPYLSGNTSNIRRSLTRTGVIYYIVRARFVLRSEELLLTLTSNGTDAYNNTFQLHGFRPFGINKLFNEANGETITDDPAIPTDAVHTFEVYRDGTTFALAIDGGSFITKTVSGNLASTDFIDLFSNVVSGGSSLNGNGTRYIWRGAFCDRVPTSGERADLLDWALTGAVGGGGGTTLVAETGVFALSGVAANLRAARKTVADTGAFTFSGQAAGLRVGRRLVAEVGVFGLGGISAGLKADRKLAAATGAFVLLGYAAALKADRRLKADSGNFGLTGYASDRVASGASGTTLLAATGVFAVTGYAAGLKAARRTVASTGVFGVSGQSATLRAARRLRADAGSFVVTGQPAGLRADRKTFASTGVFAMSGGSASLRAARRLLASTGTFALTGFDAEDGVPVVITGFLVGGRRGGAVLNGSTRGRVLNGSKRGKVMGGGA